MGMNVVERPGPSLSAPALLIVLLLVVQVNTSENDIPPLVRKHFVYGSLNQKVNVYVKMMKDSPFLACMDLDTAEKETIDPVFLWIGPDGRNLKTYLDPDYLYQIDLRYMSKPCNDIANNRFVLTLLKIVKEIITGLNCDLQNMFHKCHFIKSPKHSMQNELFISFKVNPFTTGWDKECSSNPNDCQQETRIRLEKARNLIVEFFKMQTRVLEEEFVNTPEIYYMEHSLDIIRVDSCRPGFGKNKVTHHDCPGCCVVCDPGLFSSDNSLQCEVCKDITITHYGATEC
ncbi:zona pellucida-binding protein 2 isoform 2-T2 [Anomaloglossus baeobatrachus]|uniref:zona pellucida-binding protein 2 isoform X2 n=1 Tax=Anomaloglossus baeobatrachus TaxID=238106 RepID=UPI003F505755